MTAVVLIVDDDAAFVGMVKDSLEAGGEFTVSWAESVERALSMVAQRLPDVFVLDWHIGSRSGYELCRTLKRDPRTSAVPILMLSAVSTTQRKVEALEGGADDYLTKPVDFTELRARLRALLRRAAPASAPVAAVASGDLSLDPAEYKAYLKKRNLELTKTEFEILYLLVSKGGQVVPRSVIETQILGLEAGTGARPLDIHMSRLRDKLGAAAHRLETVRGLGYLLRPS